MLFNSIEFAVFLPTVFCLYWFVFDKKLKQQNILLLLASYIFYGWWDWRFLSLIFFSSLIDYNLGMQIFKSENLKRRKHLLWGSLATNLGLLGVFKYYNFFIDSFVALSASIGLQANPSSLNIILPVGISFYTFQTLSYTIDIYRKQLEPEKDPIAFFTFVSFFPQLVAGPIERAKKLLPQFVIERKFDLENGKDGIRQILWGLFKKVVIADMAAVQVDAIFSNYETMPASFLVLGAIFFAFQIYGDFSGYSDIAIGTAKLFGFKLMTNFKNPYFSRDIGEFWRRWHISLSTWFRDYVYIPLGGSQGSKWVRIRNTLITFTISGFWHGANWTFIFWGFLNGLYYVPLMLSNKNQKYEAVVAANSFLPSLKEFLQMLVTLILTVFTWIFFRAKNLGEAFSYIENIFSSTLSVPPSGRHILIVGLISILLGIEWMQRRKEHSLQIETLPVWVRWIVYILLSLAILAFFQGNKNFIYFQF